MEGEGGGGLSFLLEDKTSAPDVFSSCSFITRAHFELWLRHMTSKVAGGQATFE